MAGLLSRSLATACQCVADFVVDDACHLCRRVARRADRDGGLIHPFQRAVSAPVVLRFLPGLSLVNHPLCVACASRLPVAVEDSVLPASFLEPVRVMAPFHTCADLLRVVHLVKFSRLTSLIGGISDALALRARSTVSALDRPVLVPVPMDRRSVERRGFNQSQRIAYRMSRSLAVPVVADALVKPRPTTPQSLTGPRERFANVAGAFVAGPGDVAGQDVVLVDDLVTTGATAAAAARVLAASGAATVTVASVGRAL